MRSKINSTNLLPRCPISIRLSVGSAMAQLTSSYCVFSEKYFAKSADPAPSTSSLATATHHTSRSSRRLFAYSAAAIICRATPAFMSVAPRPYSRPFITYGCHGLCRQADLSPGETVSTCPHRIRARCAGCLLARISPVVKRFSVITLSKFTDCIHDATKCKISVSLPDIDGMAISCSVNSIISSRLRFASCPIPLRYHNNHAFCYPDHTTDTLGIIPMPLGALRLLILSRARQAVWL